MNACNTVVANMYSTRQNTLNQDYTILILSKLLTFLINKFMTFKSTRIDFNPTIVDIVNVWTHLRWVWNGLKSMKLKYFKMDDVRISCVSCTDTCLILSDTYWKSIRSLNFIFFKIIIWYFFDTFWYVSKEYRII